MNIIDGGTITFKQTEEKCWLCRKNVNNQPNVLFTIEFDSYIHESCLKDELEKDSPNPELTFIAREFSDRDDYYKQFCHTNHLPLQMKTKWVSHFEVNMGVRILILHLTPMLFCNNLK